MLGSPQSRNRESSKMGKIAVTGASGKLGGATIEFLLQRQVTPGDIIAVVRDPTKAVALAERGVEIRRGDYTDPQSLENAFRGIDRLGFVSTSALGEERLLHHGNVVEGGACGKCRTHLLYQRHQASRGGEVRRFARALPDRSTDPRHRHPLHFLSQQSVSRPGAVHVWRRRRNGKAGAQRRRRVALDSWHAATSPRRWPPRSPRAITATAPTPSPR